MSQVYDAIVVGARCGGSPTAMLLARKGHRVLLVDRATFPSDTVSTHVIHAPGMAALARWGLDGQLAATGCPPIRTYRFDFGPFTISGQPQAIDGVDVAYCPRRTILDTMLVHAAADAGVDVREGFSVDEILVESGTVVGVRGHDAGGQTVTERATMVIGADGRNSMVAKAVTPEEYRTKPAVGPAMYSYWSGVGSAGFDVVVRDGFGMAAFPTHDDLTLVILGLQPDAFAVARHDPDGALEQALGAAPDLGEQVRSGKREERFRTAAGLSGYFRRPFGPGWALVGDAGYHLHPITAQGITDAFLDAELLADALDATFGGHSAFDEAMAGYQQARDDRVAAMYEMTFDFAQLAPPPPELAQLLGAVARSQSAMDDFASVQAGTLPIPEFFDPANVGRIMEAAGAAH
ncbi:NAD(P)/FAD-dependent oxidoreductase [Desertimonas flava]|uniref:NAD(P)/FAD-dependent oxidoreductase n=1 Tax=Desertimonas flava TaxID=2064846 RepID=UPI000E34BA04|nr:NAD(P)/FAD-dependent oxidoreductase [Desertimonas flava]